MINISYLCVKQKKSRIIIIQKNTKNMDNPVIIQAKSDQEQTPRDFPKPSSFKFTCTQHEVEVSLNQYQQELKIKLTSLKNRNIYEVLLQEKTLSQELKIFLNDIKTVYNYIQVNSNDNQKINIHQNGEIHFVFLVAFGPNSKMKKEIVIETELKEVGSVEGSNLKEHFDKLRDQIMDINKKFDDQRKKMKNILATIEQANQRLVVESEAIKLQNIECKHRIEFLEEKIKALEVLVANLYQKVEGKQIKQLPKIESVQSQISNLPIPDVMKGQISDASTLNSNKSVSILNKLSHD